MAEPRPDSRAEGEPADGQAGQGQDQAGPGHDLADPGQDQARQGQDQARPDEPGPAKRRKATSLRPPLDLPGPPDPADEWISLLTADPADE